MVEVWQTIAVLDTWCCCDICQVVDIPLQPKQLWCPFTPSIYCRVISKGSHQYPYKCTTQVVVLGSRFTSFACGSSIGVFVCDMCCKCRVQFLNIHCTPNFFLRTCLEPTLLDLHLAVGASLRNLLETKFGSATRRTRSLLRLLRPGLRSLREDISTVLA